MSLASLELARVTRGQALRMVARAKASHIGTCLSMADLLAVLYADGLRHDPAAPKWPGRDRFLLSKGHGAAILYAVLAERGYFPRDWLDRYCDDGSPLIGHASHHVPGVELSTGSLGHGLPVGCGLALAARRDGHGHRVFVLLSDGELDEGSNWEAILFAPHHKLDNLVAVVDYNKIQSFGSVAEVLDLEPLADKFRAFNWAVRAINGHDHAAIGAAFAAVPFEPGKPSVVIAHTVKGQGVGFMQNQLAWHYKSPDAAQLAAALAELGVRAIRTAFIEALCDAAAADPRVWLVTGDLGYSVLEAFTGRFPKRFLNAGVAEQNMTGIAAGLALEGKVVFTYSIANFATFRCLEQIRNDVCHHNLNVKIVAVGGGLAYASAGYSHHAVEDFAILGCLPNMTVVAPGDPVETRLAVRAFVATPGPGYLRLGKAEEPTVHTREPAFVLGKMIVVRDGPDATIVSTGGMLATCVAAADALAADGVRVTLLSSPTVVPLDEATLIESVRATGRLVTVEEHGPGGLGSLVGEALARAGVAVRFVPVRLDRSARCRGPTAADVVAAVNPAR